MELWEKRANVAEEILEERNFLKWIKAVYSRILQNSSE